MNKSKLFEFTATYCRLNVSYSIPIDIIALFCDFNGIPQCEPLPIREKYIGSNTLISIDDEKEHICNELNLYQTDFIGNSDTMKITVLSDFTMTDQSRMICRNKGTIILNVMGDINIAKSSKLLSPDGGNIFIKCNNLWMYGSADIRTCNWMDNDIINFDAISNKSNQTSKSTLDGNIYMKIKHN